MDTHLLPADNERSSSMLLYLQYDGRITIVIMVDSHQCDVLCVIFRAVVDWYKGFVVVVCTGLILVKLPPCIRMAGDQTRVFKELRIGSCHEASPELI